MQYINLDNYISSFCPLCGNEVISKTRCSKCDSEIIHQFDQESLFEMLDLELQNFSKRLEEISRIVKSWVKSDNNLSEHIIQEASQSLYYTFFHPSLSDLQSQCNKRLELNLSLQEHLKEFTGFLDQKMSDLENRTEIKEKNPFASYLETYKQKFQDFKRLKKNLKRNLHQSEYQSELYLVQQSELELSHLLLTMDDNQEKILHREELYKQLTSTNKMEIKLVLQVVEKISRTCENKSKLLWINLWKLVYRWVKTVFLGGD